MNTPPKPQDRPIPGPPRFSRHALGDLPIGIRSWRDESAARVSEPALRSGNAPYAESCTECGQITLGVLFCSRCGAARPAKRAITVNRVSDDEEPWDANQIRSAYP